MKCHILTEKLDVDNHKPLRAFTDEGLAKFEMRKAKIESIRKVTPERLLVCLDPIAFEFYKDCTVSALDILARYVPAIKQLQVPLDKDDMKKDKQSEVGNMMKVALTQCTDDEALEVGDCFHIAGSFYIQTIPLTMGTVAEPA